MVATLGGRRRAEAWLGQGCHWVAGPSASTSASGPWALPVCHGHLQHGADPATSQHLQQLREVGEALWHGLHVPLEAEWV